METVRSPYHLPPRARFPMPWPGIGQLVAAVLVLGMATLIAGSAGGQIGPAVIPLILLTSVLVNAAAFGFWTGVLSALGAFCLFSFFFIEPRHSFFTSRPQDLLMLAVMLVCAGLSGLMAGRMREQVEAAEGRADVLEVLSAATFDLSSATDEATVLGLASTVWQQASMAEDTAHALAKLRAVGIELDAGRLTALAPRLSAREEAFEPLWQAVVDRQAVKFGYRTADEVRTVEPWRLAWRNISWYLVGYDRDRMAPRSSGWPGT